MKLRQRASATLSVCLLAFAGALPADAQTARAASASAAKVRIVGIVVDQQNAVPLPGVPVEVVGLDEIVYTDVDGRFAIELPEAVYDLKVVMDGYQERSVNVDPAGQRTVTVDISLSMTRFAEEVTVTADLLDAVSSSAEAQLIERKNAPVISDNVGATEMKANGDSDAAAAMSRVPGLSVVDNQYVFVRGLGERYSNTTLAGSVLPTTEPDKKVVPLDLFPAGLLDSVQVVKTFSPDRSAEFAGGLVEIVPIKFPNRPVVDLSFGLSYFSTATGKSIPVSPLGNRDWLGYNDGARSLPDGFPANPIIRRGIYTPDVGYPANDITEFGRLLENRWTPESKDGVPGPNWGVVFGNRFGKLGVIASASHHYKEQYVDEVRRFYRIAGDATELQAISDYRLESGTQKALLGGVANVSYQFTPNQRVSVENFYSHSGRDEGRFFEGPNTENARYYRNLRLQYIEEGLTTNALAGEHFFQQWSNSRFDWRASWARASREEPDLREVLYESVTFPPAAVNLVLADESQSGFRLFNELDDDSVDLAGNWSVFSTTGGRPTQYKFGVNYVERTRAFESRRFRFIPVVANKDAVIPPAVLAQPPELLYTQANIGSLFRFNEETRPVDAYDGDQNTTAAYGMVDLVLSSRSRLIAGARLERFDQNVNTFDPFGLFQTSITSTIETTDFFPSVNFVQSLRPDMNLRLGYSATVNRPEFRELAPFEFTDVVGNRSVEGNPDLERALIQNVDARWEVFTGGRGVFATSFFYKHFDKPIERVVIASAQPIVTFQNADKARNIGVELEAGFQAFSGLFLSANYTFVDSSITLAEQQRTVQTSLERALAGQSGNLFNLITEYTAGGFAGRLLYNFFGDRISDVGANEAPDVFEQGRGSLDMVLSQRISQFTVRFSVENVTDSKYLFTQGDEDQRVFKLGRTISFSVGYNFF